MAADPIGLDRRAVDRARDGQRRDQHQRGGALGVKLWPAVAVVGSPRSLARAQEPPLRLYSTRDGLAHDRVNDIRRDSFGYLWFATWEGVTRFDGRRMVSYGTADGLPNPLVWRIAEDAHGRLWFATAGGGVARLVDEPSSAPSSSTGEPRRAFAALHVGGGRTADSVYDLPSTATGCMWCWTAAGLFRGEPRGDASFEFALAKAPPGGEWTLRFLPLATGELAFLGRDALWRWRDGAIVALPHTVDPELGDLEDVEPAGGEGDHWLVAYDRALFDFDAQALDSGDAAWRRVELAVPDGKLYRVARDDRGVIWGATTRGLVRTGGDRVAR
jgi:ligand-binding sensor domain-containing protein